MPNPSLFNGLPVLSYARIVSSDGVSIRILAPCQTMPLAFGEVFGEFGEVVGHANTLAVLSKQGEVIAHLVHFLIGGQNSSKLMLLTDKLAIVALHYN